VQPVEVGRGERRAFVDVAAPCRSTCVTYPGDPLAAHLRCRDMRIWRVLLPPVLLLFVGTATAQPVQAGVERKKVWVELREQGGFAGLDDRVVVYTDGCARVSHRTGPAVRTCPTRAQTRALRSALKHLRLGHTQASPPGADFIKYTITYKKHRVSRYTLPTTWKPVVGQLEKILHR
jgi:hypothetical protein